MDHADLIASLDASCYQDVLYICLKSARMVGCRTLEEAEVRVGRDTVKAALHAGQAILERQARDKMDGEILAQYALCVAATAKQFGVKARRVKAVWSSAKVEAADGSK